MQCLPMQLIYFPHSLVTFRYCRDGSHLRNCSTKHCPPSTMFKCPGTYCVPISKRCNGVEDCPYGDDEDGCDSANHCRGRLRCRSGVCIGLNEICDGVTQCKATGEDERGCDLQYCHPQCHCLDYSIICNMTADDLHLVTSGWRMLAVHNVLKHMPRSLPAMSLLFVDFSRNSISLIATKGFPRRNSVRYLNLSFNSIGHVYAGSLRYLTNLTFLTLDHNPIVRVQNGSLNGLPLTFFSMRFTRLKAIEAITFTRVNTLEVLLLSNNELISFYASSIEGLDMLSLLDLSNNSIEDLHDDRAVISKASYKVLVDAMWICCVLPGQNTTCLSNKGKAFTKSCDSAIPKGAKAVGITLVIFTIFFGAAASFVNISHFYFESKTRKYILDLLHIIISVVDTCGSVHTLLVINWAYTNPRLLLNKRHPAVCLYLGVFTRVIYLLSVMTTSLWSTLRYKLVVTVTQISMAYFKYCLAGLLVLYILVIVAVPLPYLLDRIPVHMGPSCSLMVPTKAPDGAGELYFACFFVLECICVFLHFRSTKYLFKKIGENIRELETLQIGGRRSR